jgi:hypothetical protein
MLNSVGAALLITVKPTENGSFVSNPNARHSSRGSSARVGVDFLPTEKQAGVLFFAPNSLDDWKQYFKFFVYNVNIAVGKILYALPSKRLVDLCPPCPPSPLSMSWSKICFFAFLIAVAACEQCTAAKVWGQSS